jgi:hypothetical protein
MPAPVIEGKSWNEVHGLWKESMNLRDRERGDRNISWEATV